MSDNSDGGATPAAGHGMDEITASVHESIFRETDDAVFIMRVEVVDGEYTFTYTENNPSHQQRTGIATEELRGQTPQELLSEEQAAEVTVNYRRCVEQAATIEYEETLTMPGGTIHWKTTLTPIVEEGTVTQIVGIARDVTRTKEQQAELQRVYHQLKSVMRTMSAAVFLKDTDGQYLMVNHAYRELFGSENQEIVGLKDTELFPPDIAERYRADEKRVIERGEVIEREEEVPTATGTTVRLTRKSPVYDDTGSVIALCGVSTDITEQNQREQELKRTSQFLSDTQELAHVGGWEIDLQSETGRWSDEVYRIHGLPVGEAVTPEEAIAFYHPDDRETIREAYERLTTDGEPYDLVLRLIRADTDEVRWVRTRGEPVFEGGQVVTVHGAFQDVTEQKRREQELEQNNDRLTEFTNVVSHDLRNPLNVAQGRATLLAQQAGESCHEHLTPLVTALDRMEQIIEDTLTLARHGQQVGEMRPIPVGELVTTCWDGVQTGEATLEVDETFTVQGDSNRLQHVFENLFRNAVEHAGEEPTVRVGRLAEGGIYVEDDGPGIRVADREDVFDPGYTSSAAGSGFGLAIVKRIAEAHGWDVTVTDGRDGGARFEFVTDELPNP